MIIKYLGDKRSIEARSQDRGRTWEGKRFDAGRETKFSKVTREEVEEMARKHEMQLVR